MQCKLLSSQCKRSSIQCKLLSIQCKCSSSRCKLSSSRCKLPSIQCMRLSSQCKCLSIQCKCLSNYVLMKILVCFLGISKTGTSVPPVFCGPLVPFNFPLIVSGYLKNKKHYLVTKADPCLQNTNPASTALLIL